jgi:hypothetical protein
MSGVEDCFGAPIGSSEGRRAVFKKMHGSTITFFEGGEDGWELRKEFCDRAEPDGVRDSFHQSGGACYLKSRSEGGIRWTKLKLS